MSRLLVFLLFLVPLVFTDLQGQEQQKKEGVYLKDGSYILGRIYNRSGSTIDMVLQSGDTLHLDKKNIRRIKEDHLNPYRVDGKIVGAEVVKKQRYFKTQGVFIEASLSSGTFGALDLSAGYRFKPWLMAGAGIAHNTEIVNSGFERVSSTVPYFQGRIYLNKGGPKLYIGQKLGWFFRSDDNNIYNRTGLSSRTQLGLLFANRKKVKWTIFISQSFTRLKYTQVRLDEFNNPLQYEFKGFNATLALIGFGVHF